MIEKLDEIQRRFQDVELKLADPKVISDLKLFKQLNIEYKELSKIVEHISEYKKTLSNIEHAKEILENEKEIAKSQVQGKPANIVDKIVEGKLSAFYDAACLSRQKFIRDEIW